MSEQVQTARERVLHHPEWCFPSAGYCEAERSEDGYVIGWHREAPQRIKTHYGPTLRVGLICEALGEDDPRIELRIPEPCDDDDHDRECEHYTFAGSVNLEPEEALLLARRLQEAVQDWRNVRQGPHSL